MDWLQNLLQDENVKPTKGRQGGVYQFPWAVIMMSVIKSQIGWYNKTEMYLLTVLETRSLTPRLQRRIFFCFFLALVLSQIPAVPDLTAASLQSLP